MPWLQLSLEAGALDLERLSQFFETQGALSITFQDAADQSLFEPKPGETPLWQATRIIALFGADIDTDRLCLALNAAFGKDAADRLLVEKLADRDWERAWLDDFRPMRFGERLWVCPAGMRPSADDAVIIDLDPGLAFGTGTHPTTALCLEWLDRHPPVGREVLDYGCGSGVLGIAALKLGAAGVMATDIDPQALWASRENAARNGVEDRLQTVLPDALPADYRAGVLLANILANPLMALAGTLAGRVTQGAELVLSGILAEQAEQVAAAYAPWFRLEKPVRRDGWVCLCGTRKPTTGAG